MISNRTIKPSMKFPVLSRWNRLQIPKSLRTYNGFGGYGSGLTDVLDTNPTDTSDVTTPDITTTAADVPWYQSWMNKAESFTTAVQPAATGTRKLINSLWGAQPFTSAPSGTRSTARPSAGASGQSNLLPLFAIGGAALLFLGKKRARA